MRVASPLCLHCCPFLSRSPSQVLRHPATPLGLRCVRACDAVKRNAPGRTLPVHLASSCLCHSCWSLSACQASIWPVIFVQHQPTHSLQPACWICPCLSRSLHRHFICLSKRVDHSAPPLSHQTMSCENIVNKVPLS